MDANSHLNKNDDNSPLSRVETELRKLKYLIKDSYNKIKSCKTTQDNLQLNENFEKLFTSLNAIHKESFNLDDVQVWESFLTHTDAKTFDEFEKTTYDEFIFSAQICRGKLAGIKVLQIHLYIYHMHHQEFQKQIEEGGQHKENNCNNMDVDSNI